MDWSIKEIIARVLAGESTQEERKILMDWVKQNEANRKDLEQIEGIWNAIELLKNQEQFDPSKGFEGFQKLQKKKNIEQPETIKKKQFNYYIQIAAAIVFLFGIPFLIWQNSQKPTEEIAFFEFTTPKGSYTKLTLIDGTNVWLNAGSNLKCPNKFDGKTRTVYLDGEAFFNVKKDSLHPFIVQTSEIMIKAMGTSFNVKAYAKEGSVETTLIDGEVIIEGNSLKKKFSPVRLTPKQRVTFIKKSGKLLLNDDEQKLLTKNEVNLQSVEREKESLLVTEDVNTEVFTSWVGDKLLFDNETFESIAIKLERRYGATIIFQNDELKSIRFSGKFPEISIDRVLKAFQFASPFKYRIKEDTIYINH